MSSDLVFLFEAVSLLTLTSDPTLHVLVESHQLWQALVSRGYSGKGVGGAEVQDAQPQTH